MSRVYLTASMKHGNLMPTFSVDTADHTGGDYTVGGLHPSSIAAMAGKGPEIKKGERFDLKANLNAQRTSLSLVVCTTKHLPHLEWSLESGMGKLPGVGALAIGATALLGVDATKLLGIPSTSKSKPSSKSHSSDKRRQDGSRNGEKSRSGDRRRCHDYDDDPPRPANKGQRAIMPREEHYKERDRGYESYDHYEKRDRYDKQRKPSSRTHSRR